MISDREQDGGHHVERFEFLFKQEIKAYSHDYCVADHTDLLQQLALQNSAQSACKQAYAALINQHGNADKNNTEAERCAENNRINKVQRALDKKHGAVTRQTVIY